MGSPLSAYWWLSSGLRFTGWLCQVSLMSYGWVWLISDWDWCFVSWKVFAVFSRCCPRFLCVWTRHFLLPLCNACMVSYRSIIINQSSSSSSCLYKINFHISIHVIPMHKRPYADLECKIMKVLEISAKIPKILTRNIRDFKEWAPLGTTQTSCLWYNNAHPR